MLHLLYTAKNANDEPVQGFVDANSTEEALAKLTASGHYAIAFLQDASTAEDDKLLAAMSEEEVAELARFRVLVMAQPGLKTVLQEVARRNRMGLLFDIGLLAWGIWSANVWVVLVTLVLALLPFALAAWRFRGAQDYQSLLRAHAIGDKATVQQLAQKLRAVSGTVKSMEFDLDVRLASLNARGGGGRLDQALASVQGWRDRMPDAVAMYECRIAAIYAAAGDRGGFVAAMQRAFDASNNDPSRALDLALAEARFGDLERAQSMLDSVNTALIPVYGAGFVLWTRGLCELRGNEPQALATLGLAVAEFLKLASQPAVWTALAFCTCDHSVALVFAGDRERARMQLDSVWPIVRAHADAPLLKLLQAQGLLEGKTFANSSGQFP